MRRYSVLLLGFLLLNGLLPSAPAWARRKRSHPPPQPMTLAEIAAIEDPKPNEVCFSPDEPCGAKLIKFVQGAKKSLDLAIYDINLDQLVHTLAVASRKLPVRVIVDQRQSKGEHSLVGVLAKAGVNIRFGRQRGIMHNKFVIRDGAMLETGSFNFTNHATIANNENQLYSDRPEVVSRYVSRFNKIWDEAQPVLPAAAPSGLPPAAGKPGNAEEGNSNEDTGW